jgi:hypothetical protein
MPSRPPAHRLVRHFPSGAGDAQPLPMDGTPSGRSRPGLRTSCETEAQGACAGVQCTRQTTPVREGARLPRTICVPWRQQVSGRAPEKDGKPEARPAWSVPSAPPGRSRPGFRKRTDEPEAQPPAGAPLLSASPEDRQVNPPGPGAPTGRLWSRRRVRRPGPSAAFPGESGEGNHAATRLARYSSSQPAVLRRRRIESLPGALRVRL